MSARAAVSIFALLCLSAPIALAKTPAGFERIDEVVNKAIGHGEVPGAVVLVWHRGKVVFRKAYGLRSKQPTETPMTFDTLFDLASLTKPIATATSIMILVEGGQLRPGDPVAQYLPEFAKNGKEKITIAQLLLHTSGLIADNPVSDYEGGKDKALARIYQLRPESEPGSHFKYSDVNYIVLGEIVGRLGGAPLDEYARKNIFEPLGMTQTGFRPGGELKNKAAPTEQRNGAWMLGEVHDPRAYLMGGVAGHAGLFSTPDDLVLYLTMILRHGALGGRRILSPLAVQTMITPRAVPGGLRAYGWDVDTSYSSNRGELFQRGRGFGHTGFTGTSIWFDPDSDSAVVFLSNRVHPVARANINRLRGQVATVAAAAISILDDADRMTHTAGREGLTVCEEVGTGSGQACKITGKSTAGPVPVPIFSQTLTGLDVLVREKFKRLKGARVGLVTNHTGLDQRNRSTIDLLRAAPDLSLVALFSPEHGIRGSLDEKIPDGHDPQTGLAIYSLYGSRRRPAADQLRGVDTLVYDIQDAGCRFYTYISTLGYLLEAAAERSKNGEPLKVVVLDRPNPIGGLAVEGPVLDACDESFVGYHRLPVRHGMTVGELALLYNSERNIGAKVEVVPMEGWRRSLLFDQTGLHWVKPSPNLGSLTQALLYPGIGLLETTNLSVGRGTDRPFEWVGAPWIDGRRLADALAGENLAGVSFAPLRMTPTASTHKGQLCDGVQLFITDWQRFQPLRTGLAVAAVLKRLFPKDWRLDRYAVLLGNEATFSGLKRGAPWQELVQAWEPALAQFRGVRARYLIYPD
jgi:uncharacterized protein YbbC (DUF1343 family)/CubicO group peptidase (beta-lactamase class C family)